MNHVDNKEKGFTLIELLLAMTFIAALLLAIAMTIVQIANIYNHGMILKEVNQTARAMTEELDSAMRASTTFSTDPADHQYVSNAWGGRLCVGQYSYVWNYGTSLASVNPNRNMYSGINTAGNNVTVGNTTHSEISFVKILDPSGSYCVPNGSGGYPDVSPTNATELLRSGDHSLAIHAFAITSTPTAKDALSAQQLYKVSFTLGTSDINALNTDQSQCKAPNVSGSDPNYCSVEQFSIVLRAVSGVN
jgi:Tfp pilus assembly protein PilV